MLIKKLSQTFVILTAGLMLASCGNSSEEENKTNGGVGMVSESASAPTSLTPTERPMPDMENLQGRPQDFPHNYPLQKYPGSQVILARIEPVLYPGWHNQVMLKSNDHPAVIEAFYIKKLIADGWKKTYEYATPVYVSTKWEKGDTEVEVRVSPDPYGQKNVQLFYGPVSRPVKPAHPSIAAPRG